jgi:hypothetical protein
MRAGRWTAIRQPMSPAEVTAFVQKEQRMWRAVLDRIAAKP